MTCPCHRVHTGPGKFWNLKIWIPGLESPGSFVEVLDSPGIWTYRFIFLIISIQEFSRYTSSEIWVYLCVLKVREFIEKVIEFDIGKSWNLICQNVYEHCVTNMNSGDKSIPNQNYQFQFFFTMSR